MRNKPITDEEADELLNRIFGPSVELLKIGENPKRTYLTESLLLTKDHLKHLEEGGRLDVGINSREYNLILTLQK